MLGRPKRRNLRGIERTAAGTGNAEYSGTFSDGVKSVDVCHIVLVNLQTAVAVLGTHIYGKRLFFKVDSVVKVQLIRLVI